MQIQEHYSLKKQNTFGIESSARYYVQVHSVEELKEILSDSKFKNLSKLILGGGSNILFTKNFEGLVIQNQLSGIELINEDQNNYFVKAAAGVVWHTFVQYCIEKNYAGLENLSLIPGCVGAAPMQNIGAYGVEMKDCFYSLEALNMQSLEVEIFNKEQCKFGYRESVFKNELKGKYIILSVTFQLNKKPNFQTQYGAIAKELEMMGVQDLSIAAISQAVINIRRSKLPDPSELGNAGSFFKNPEIDAQTYQHLLKSYPEIVAYSLENGNFKLAAGWLIEKAGWKGKRVNNCGVHTLQALVLVNYSNASGEEIYSLSEAIINDVFNKFGVHLQREVNIF